MICPQCGAWMPQNDGPCQNCGFSLAPVDPLIGTVLAGRFRLDNILGSGEIGMVYKGLDLQNEQEVAVKLIHPDVVETHGDEILRAASELAQLRHVKLASILAAARTMDGKTFVVTEFVEGETLSQLLARTGPLPAGRVADILFQICSALAPLHRVGRPHGNLKPANIFLAPKPGGGDAVKICDATSPTLIGVRETSQETKIIGNAKYFSPEQAMGAPAEPASDQFSLGVIGYQLLSGALPFFGATPEQLLLAIARGMPTALPDRMPSLQAFPELVSIVGRCLQKHPLQRFSDLRALAQELASVIKSQPTQKTPNFRYSPRESATVIAGNVPGLNPMAFIHGARPGSLSTASTPPAGASIADRVTMPRAASQSMEAFSSIENAINGFSERAPRSNMAAEPEMPSVSVWSTSEITRSNVPAPAPSESLKSDSAEPFNPFSDMVITGRHNSLLAQSAPVEPLASGPLFENTNAAEVKAEAVPGDLRVPAASEAVPDFSANLPLQRKKLEPLKREASKIWLLVGAVALAALGIGIGLLLRGAKEKPEEPAAKVVFEEPKAFEAPKPVYTKASEILKRAQTSLLAAKAKVAVPALDAANVPDAQVAVDAGVVDAAVPQEKTTPKVEPKKSTKQPKKPKKPTASDLENPYEF